MATYPIKKVLSDYDLRKMDMEMTLGHALQHIAKLYEAQADANIYRQTQRRRFGALMDEVHSLQVEVGRLQKAQDQTSQLRKLGNGLAALERTVTVLMAEVDSLTEED